jgi:hypothetical protein
MSSGAFLDSFYDSNKSGSVHPIRIQPETLALTLGGQANDAPDGASAVVGSAVVSRGKRSRGLNARTVSIRFTAAKTDYKPGSIIRLPWLDPATFDALIPKVTTGTYLATACIVVGTTPETFN